MSWRKWLVIRLVKLLILDFSQVLVHDYKSLYAIGIQRQGKEQKTSDEEQWQHEASSDGTSLRREGLVEEKPSKLMD